MFFVDYQLIPFHLCLISAHFFVVSFVNTCWLDRSLPSPSNQRGANLETAFFEIFDGKTPAMWLKHSYPSLKLGVFFRALRERCMNKTPPKFNSSPLKNDAWKMEDDPFLLGETVTFQGRAVKLREGIM